MSIHEIGAAFPDETFGNESRIGVPFTHVLRDILQFDKVIDLNCFAAVCTHVLLF